jgi:hypothetical protein
MPKELQEAVPASQGQPVRLSDPDTDAEYVVLPAQVYDQMQELLSVGTQLAGDERQGLLVKSLSR